MPSFADLIQQGAAQAWIFVPSAILLGALHGLEPGHSKTMMAAFIVAIRGTIGQAVLLGLAATVSHTVIVWAIALGGMYLWRDIAPEALEPWFQLAAGLIVIGIALWIMARTRAAQRRAADASDHGHAHHHHGPHADTRRIDTGHGAVRVTIHEDGLPPRWRLRSEGPHGWSAAEVTIVTERADGASQTFAFADRGSYLESLDPIPEPHDFVARLKLGHGGHSHDYDLAYLEGDGHDHLHEEMRGLRLATSGHQDAHQLAHADDARRRFAGRNVSTGQIVLFGLTGGLIPCPAAITVLLVCLQLREIPLGVVLVLSFSVGLALTLVTVGAIAAYGVRHVARRLNWFSALARKAPYISSALIILVGLYMAAHGALALSGQAGEG